MTITCATLMCHAPIVIPEIAGERAAACAATTAAMHEAAAVLVDSGADVLVLISPHAPRDRSRFGVVRDALLEGDFARFGVPEVALRARGAVEAAERLSEVAARRGLSTWSPSGRGLDHGALVPLYFVLRAGFRGPVLLVALPYPDVEREVELGRAIADTAAELGQRFAVLASGDMSHRLLPDAPAGFDPRARRFDASFRELIARGELRAATRVDPELRELAAEDVVDSCAVAAGAVDFDARGHRVLAYEGPFGVGYLEAVLHDARAGAHESRAVGTGRSLLELARRALAAHLRGEAYELPAPAADAPAPRGVFVTLRGPGGALRGCIGHVEPVYDSLAEEVATCAVDAARKDTRFAPVTADELPELTLEISLLSECEPVAGVHELDPARYGVVVSRGGRRGVLLPGIEGVTSAEQQLRIAATKAGIAQDGPFELQRFTVEKLREPSCSS